MFVLVALLCGAWIVGWKTDRLARSVVVIDAKPLGALTRLLEMKQRHLVTDVHLLSPSQSIREVHELFERGAMPARWSENADAEYSSEKTYLLERIGSRIDVLLDEPDRVADVGPFVGARRKLIEESVEWIEREQRVGIIRPPARLGPLVRVWRKQAVTGLPGVEFCEREGGQTAWQLTVTLSVHDSISPSVESMTRDSDPVGRIARCVESTMRRWFAGTVRSVPLHYTIRVW